MADTEAPFRAVYERDPQSDAWLARIDGVDGCHTYGRNLGEAKERIREALALWLDREPEDLAILHRRVPTRALDKLCRWT